MSSSSVQSHSSASQYVAPSTFNSDSLQSFLKKVSALASSPESQAASAMIEEFGHQREQVHARNEELKKAQNEILDLKERKRVAIEEMFAANESEKAKQKEALDQVDCETAETPRRSPIRPGPSSPLKRCLVYLSHLRWSLPADSTRCSARLQPSLSIPPSALGVSGTPLIRG
ncbi:hypothetical protein CBS147325_9942 [Penicillium roqueforti]|nr:hypothetical protein CBS147325_9942 [Penicillium roqueforti]KAI3148282.1 hypothetical protein DTO046C5_9878 [Penicillium roqueforti]